jgi:phosphoribosylformimino-5-aminoimidazole carboxamide ribotide isomerase
MHFRPCIDIHNGKVKQIVGSSLRDSGDAAKDNFVSEHSSEYFADIYKEKKLENSHVIILNSADSEFYEASKKAAMAALREYPEHMMVGGGITAENAGEYLDAGANAVIVTSYIFSNGQINEKNLNRILMEAGREHLVLDLTCRYRNPDNSGNSDYTGNTDKAINIDNTLSGYYVVTDRWQKFSDVRVTPELLRQLSADCREFLIHGADSEGKKLGIERELCSMLGDYFSGGNNPDKTADNKDAEMLQKSFNPVTYAGGISSVEDIELLGRLSENRLDFTIGSALDIFGGNISFDDISDIYR